MRRSTGVILLFFAGPPAVYAQVNMERSTMKSAFLTNKDAPGRYVTRGIALGEVCDVRTAAPTASARAIRLKGGVHVFNNNS